MTPEIGRFLIYTGLVLVALGILIVFFGSKLSWLGSLPGDIRMERGNTRVYFPIVTMIVLSIVLTIIINLFRRFF
ncbi:MAG: DUF2905 domain-containing protein [Candidatus Cyclonatronum sp.]|uniref:DUF2905 domain-containing protein n=1 Tax=Cyclonatronum sp. TaxID=3024185 RepID=UPI0025B7BA82|nr:DUF2905 domain-containing protein [Cyclonatronum sp.]MCC5934527.1 DUF2905 domain-containing protein [Balneolales bacterium]MCH8486556.1 DUF2905 domain-containing protein [Cyclonatronum sp.]